MQVLSTKNQRILIKISGEYLNPLQSTKSIMFFKNLIEELKSYNHKIAIVIGGGNILRGRESSNIDRLTRDNIGMLGTVINGLAISSLLSQYNINNIHAPCFEIDNIVSKKNNEYINEQFLNDKVIIFTGGTGQPYFSTDTATVIKASMLNCDYIFKITKTDGIYDKDPENNKDAKLIKKISYKEVANMNCTLFDSTAAMLAQNINIPTLIFKAESSLSDVINNKVQSSIIC